MSQRDLVMRFDQSDNADNTDRRVLFVGLFDGHFYRIHSYVSACATFGLTCELASAQQFMERLEAGAAPRTVVFNDEISIRKTNEFFKSRNTMGLEVRAQVEQLSQFTDKGRVRRLSQEVFPHAYTVIDAGGEVTAAACDLLNETGAVVVKPANGSFSRSVRKCVSIEELCKCLSDWKVSGSIVVEEYVSGDNYCLDVAWNGDDVHLIGFCWKITSFSEAPYTVAFTAIESPQKSITEDALRRLRNVFQEHCPGIKSVFHCELIYDHAGDQSFLVEINPRGAGGWLPEFYSISRRSSYDVNLIRNLISLAPTCSGGHTPAALGIIANSSFFDKVEKPESSVNLVYERFSGEDFFDGSKVGRFLLWGDSSDKVSSSLESILAAAMPICEPQLHEIVSSTSSSKCC